MIPTVVTKHHNVYWFDPDDMTALVNSPGHVLALEFLQELAATGSPSQLGWELGEAWDNFLNDNAVLLFSWGDVGSLAQDPNFSVIQGKLGGAPIPCSEVWYDFESLVNSSKTRKTPIVWATWSALPGMA
jgi:multiple sugar transport system substrate-binding protein